MAEVMWSIGQQDDAAHVFCAEYIRDEDAPPFPALFDLFTDWCAGSGVIPISERAAVWDLVLTRIGADSWARR